MESRADLQFNRDACRSASQAPPSRHSSVDCRSQSHLSRICPGLSRHRLESVDDVAQFTESTHGDARQDSFGTGRRHQRRGDRPRTGAQRSAGVPGGSAGTLPVAPRPIRPGSFTADCATWNTASSHWCASRSRSASDCCSWLRSSSGRCILFIPVTQRVSGFCSAARKFLDWPTAGQDKYVPRGLWLVRMGLLLYDWCARHSSLPRHRVHRLRRTGGSAGGPGAIPLAGLLLRCAD